MIKIVKVKLNVDMLSYKAGSTLILTNQKYSNEGIFLDSYFKNRIKDSKIDNCLIILDREIEIEKNPIEELNDDYKELEKETKIESRNNKLKKSRKRDSQKIKKD